MVELYCVEDTRVQPDSRSVETKTVVLRKGAVLGVQNFKNELSSSIIGCLADATEGKVLPMIFVF
jgi:hypothetical protein